MRGAKDDRRRAAVEDSKAAADYGLLVNRIAETRTRTKVVLVFGTGARVDAKAGQQRVRILYGRASHPFVVVAQTQVKSQLRIETKIILSVEGVFRKIRTRRAPRRAGAREILCVSSRRVVRECGVVRKRVHAAEY